MLTRKYECHFTFLRISSSARQAGGKDTGPDRSVLHHHHVHHCHWQRESKRKSVCSQKERKTHTGLGAQICFYFIHYLALITT